jgi:outer membrane protein assembly factor BamE (lipoprotein component of BamABCDE complex)
MNKQFGLLVLATLSLNLGAVTLSFANAVPVRYSTPLISKATKPDIKLTKTSISSLQIGMTTKQVLKLKGKPLAIEKDDYGLCYWGKASTFKYPNLEVMITENGYVQSITITGENHSTKEGLRVGDPIHKARKVYSEKFRAEENASSVIYPNIYNGGLVFYFNDQGIITKIFLLYGSC